MGRLHYTLPQAAQALGISMSYLLKLISLGHLTVSDLNKDFKPPQGDELARPYISDRVMMSFLERIPPANFPRSLSQRKDLSRVSELRGILQTIAELDKTMQTISACQLEAARRLNDLLWQESDTLPGNISDTLLGDLATLESTTQEIRSLIHSDTESQRFVGFTRKEKKVLKETEQKHEIIHMLRQTHGNVTKAAKTMGLHRQELQRMMRKYSIDKKDFKPVVRLQEGDLEPHTGEGIFYSIPEVAAILGVDPVSVYRYIRAGKLKTTQIGKKTYISDEALAEYKKHYVCEH